MCEVQVSLYFETIGANAKKVQRVCNSGHMRCSLHRPMRPYHANDEHWWASIELMHYVNFCLQVLVKDLLRKYPQWSHDCIAVVGSVSSKTVTEPKAKAALVWMLGEYAYDMLDAPYILEGFIDNWAEEDSAEVCIILVVQLNELNVLNYLHRFQWFMYTSEVTSRCYDLFAFRHWSSSSYGHLTPKFPS